MKYKVLVSAPYLIPVLEQYTGLLERQGCEVIQADVIERLGEDDLLSIMHDIDGVICGDDAFTKRVLDASPKLQVLSKWGTGIDSIDQIACAERNIKVKNVPNAFSDPVADTVLGWVLSFARRFQEQTASIRNGEWEKLPGYALNEKTIGVIGVGNVGKAVIKRASAFGMKIIGTDLNTIDNDFLTTFQVKMTDLSSLLSGSDFISLNCDLNQTNAHLINSQTLSMCKHGTIILNSARGGLICENDLIEALESGLVGGVGLDVYEHEPLAINSALRSMVNVILSAHNANSSPNAWANVHIQSIKNLLEELN